ncbi:MAG TPA: aldo/keto reductase [Acidimicrobiia bacterium]|nr:aldo/keto reductase [Acidimicrobiia bacterium]
MDYYNLGHTGLRISAFGMGCGNFGGIGSAPEFFGQGESEEEAFNLLDRAVDLGINYLDTANAYGGGRSETTIGKWLATKDASVRDNLLISSKVANPVGEGPNQSGLSRRHILQQIDASLGRLGVDHLDMYIVHEPDPTTPLEETLDALDSLVVAGKVRYIGASNFPAWLMAKSLWLSDVAEGHRFEWIQNSFNLIDQEEQNEVLELCRDQGLGFTNFSPLCGGFLTGKYRYDDDYPEGSRMTKRPEPYLEYWNRQTFDAIDELAGTAAEMGVSVAGLALGWLYHHPDVTSSIVGPRRPSHFDPVEEAMSFELSETDWDQIGGLFRKEVTQ